MINIGEFTKVNLLLVGCGGTGGQFLPFLMQLCNNVKSKIGDIVLIDGDDFEEHNCINQKCLEEEVGENKAEALAERFGYIYEDLNISYYSDYIRCTKDLLSLMPAKLSEKTSLTVLISAVDRNSSRKIFHKLFNIANEEGHSMAYIDSGNGDINRVGQIITGFTKGGEILSRPVADYFPEILEDKEDLTKLQNCTQVASEHPQNIATNIMAASIIFSVVTNIITFGKIEKGVIYFDANRHTVVSR